MLKRLAVFVVALLFSAACNPVPPQLSTTGGIAYRANQVTLGLVALKDVAKEGEARGLFTREEAYAILDATKVALIASNDLGHSLQAGGDATTAKAAAIASIQDALTRVPPQLSAQAQTVIAPYVATIQAILASLG